MIDIGVLEHIINNMKEINLKENIGKTIKKYRKAKKLTQMELGQCIGVGQRQIALIENGKSYPSFQTTIKIAETFDITLSDLFSENEILKEDIENKILKLIKNFTQDELLQLYKIMKVIKYK